MMTQELQTIISSMNMTERIALVQDILYTISDEQPRPPLSQAVKAELKRRIADMEANPHDFVPWETALASALARCGQ
jgi:putative addiction module component (TIGR02574 family)